MSRHQFKYAQHHFFFRTMAWLFRFSWILNLRRLIFRYIPYLRMESQAAETVYMSWLVDYDRVKQRFPEPIQLWQKDGKTIFRYYVATAQNYNNQLFNKKEAKLNLASLKITISNLYKTNITNDYLYFDYV